MAQINQERLDVKNYRERTEIHTNSDDLKDNIKEINDNSKKI